MTDTLRQGLLRSYSMVFFSKHPVFAGYLVAASFVDPLTGLSGLLSAAVALVAAHLFGLNTKELRNGIFSFNALLSGLALGSAFQFHPLAIVVVSLLTLLLTLVISAVTSRFNLPFLSLPFVVAGWVIALNPVTVNCCFTPRAVSDFFIAQQLSGPLDELFAHSAAGLYLRSLSAIFFQNNCLSGLLIAIGLLVYSRIAFLLSVTGFAAGWIWFKVTGGLPADAYYYSSFNYILTAIGLCGFFLLPSRSSLLFAIASMPVVGLLYGACAVLFRYSQLPVYSLPFSLATLAMVTALSLRRRGNRLRPVYLQLYSPENNLYRALHYDERFKSNLLLPVNLPFFGEWYVSQAHGGPVTHKGAWQHAWDFVVHDEHQRTFRLPGKQASDFYCFGLPVLAPADGTVVSLLDGIEDNVIGDVNLNENWGNTVVIRHGEGLYSKLSHLKKNSLKVLIGDAVRKGEMIAQCGNSGRSPEPHLHFQLQSSPIIGAPTIAYPLALYVLRRNGKSELRNFSIPEAGDTVARPAPYGILKRAFAFRPGDRLDFSIDEGNRRRRESWEMNTDEDNSSYLTCVTSGDKAWYVASDSLFAFTSFSGSRRSLLYYFYLGAGKVLLSYVPGLVVRDHLPVGETYGRTARVIQDLLAPLHVYLKAESETFCQESDRGDHPAILSIFTTLKHGRKRKTITTIKTVVTETGIESITIQRGKLCITAKRI